MHERKVILAITISCLFLIGLYYYTLDPANVSPDQVTEASGTPALKNGERTSHRKDGSKKTVINYLNGLKHGDSFMYYDDGETVQLKMTYVHGQRHGTSIKYFDNGSVYAETPYAYDKLHGVRKTYYRNGKTKAEMPYGYGLPGIGLQEYFQSGNEKELPEIVTWESSAGLTLTISGPCKEPRFYIGELIEDSFFDDKDREHKPIHAEDGQYVIDLQVFTPSYLAMQDIICQCTTSQGNPLIIRKRVIL